MASIALVFDLSMVISELQLEFLKTRFPAQTCGQTILYIDTKQNEGHTTKRGSYWLSSFCSFQKRLPINMMTSAVAFLGCLPLCSKGACLRSRARVSELTSSFHGVRRIYFGGRCTSRVSTPAMARERRSQNIAGDVFVDTSCIDCDTCRWLAPKTFRHESGQSAVYSQPEGPEERKLALAAAVACPTGSIRTETPTPEMKDAQLMFPMPMNDEGTVYYLGFTSPDTFAASSWLCISPTANLMIDIPRYNSGLARRIEKIIEQRGRPGSRLDYIVMSHKDDVAGHAKWAERFTGVPRMIHKTECNDYQGTDACEIKLTLGDEKNDDRMRLTDDIEILHVPGHTWGSIAVLDRHSQSLFTGDHLFYSPKLGHLFGSTRFISYSWREVQRSTSKLTEEPFLHLYPGHGRAFHFVDANDRREVLRKTVEKMSKARARVP